MYEKQLTECDEMPDRLAGSVSTRRRICRYRIATFYGTEENSRFRKLNENSFFFPFGWVGGWPVRSTIYDE